MVGVVSKVLFKYSRDLFLDGNRKELISCAALEEQLSFIKGRLLFRFFGGLLVRCILCLFLIPLGRAGGCLIENEI